MRAHRNIYEVPGGWYVIIKRGPVTYRAFFAHSAFATPHSALEAARAARDRFLLNYPQTYSGQAVRSGTGIAGVSECIKWFHEKPYPCFQVTCGHPRHGIKRFYYKSGADRPRALRAAIAWRKKLEAKHSTLNMLTLDVQSSMLNVECSPSPTMEAAHA